MAESNLTVFQEANVPRGATLGVAWRNRPPLPETVSEINTDHVVDVVWDDAFLIGQLRVFFVT